MKPTRFLLLLLAVVLSAPAFASTKVLGKLGQALNASSIYAGSSTRTRAYYKVKPYEYLVVRQTRKAGWVAVLLQNGSYGYMQASKVAVLPYEVTAKAPAQQASRGSAPSASRSALANYSLNYLGTPYKWGGTDMNNGVDCSAFMKGLFGKIGMKLPRTAAEQVRVGQAIHRLEDLQPGDRLYFWSSKRNKIGHTGIYLGRGYFVHASSGSGKVTTSYLGGKYWLQTLVAARR
jgi:cell wall-associated NlpC family hydrolase